MSARMRRLPGVVIYWQTKCLENRVHISDAVLNLCWGMLPLPLKVGLLNLGRGLGERCNQMYFTEFLHPGNCISWQQKTVFLDPGPIISILDVQREELDLSFLEVYLQERYYITVLQLLPCLNTIWGTTFLRVPPRPHHWCRCSYCNN